MTLLGILDRVNMRMMRRQQLRQGLMKASQSFFACQDLLRQILSQVTSPDPGELAVAGTLGTSDITISGALGIEEEPGREQQMLMQLLMQAATQPSPLKAIFTRDEMEVSVKRPLPQ